MSLQQDRILLNFIDRTSESKIKNLLKSHSLEFDNVSEDDKNKGYRIANTANCKFLCVKKGFTLEPDKIDLAVKQDSDINWVAPVYRIEGTTGIEGLISPLPHILVIKLKDKISSKEKGLFEVKIEELGLREIKEKSELLKPFRYFRLNNPKEKNVYELREHLKKEFEIIDSIFFENTLVVSPLLATANDTHFNLQWNLNQINASGNGMTAWDRTTGNNNINIAILDQGCDLTHPDIIYANNGFNPSTGNLNGGETGPHGTACAGIAAASINTNQGIAGVAGGCSIIPVNLTPWSDVNTAAGINWAANNRANVISMSFGVYAVGEGQGPIGWNFALIDPAIANAVNNRNCVLVAATGNENINTVNRYPSRHPLVIAVGASDQADNRKSPTSPDGETWWGSNWGMQAYNGLQTGVSVTAPGVLIPTTDNQGIGGYNANGVNGDGDTAGNYFFRFNGTSSATPHVAGLAALILSLNNNLSPQQVRDIIEQTAAKVGTVTYNDNPNFPNGTWNQEMGYGRIDTLAAVNSLGSWLEPFLKIMMQNN